MPKKWEFFNDDIISKKWLSGSRSTRNGMKVKQLMNRVASVFLVQHTKWPKIYQMAGK
jgi:hypothetical protein